MLTIDDKLTYIKSNCQAQAYCAGCRLTLGRTCPEKLWKDWTPEEIERAYDLIYKPKGDTTTSKLKCDDCLCDIYPWDKLYNFEGEWLCADCFERKFDELSLDEKAQLIGSEVREGSDFLDD